MSEETAHFMLKLKRDLWTLLPEMIRIIAEVRFFVPQLFKEEPPALQATLQKNLPNVARDY